MLYQSNLVIKEVNKAITAYTRMYPEFTCSYSIDDSTDGTNCEILHKVTLSTIVNSAKITLTRNLCVALIKPGNVNPEEQIVSQLLTQLEHAFLTLDTDYKRLCMLPHIQMNDLNNDM